jgi:hypothetical protein
MNPTRPANNKPPDLRWGITQKWIIRWSLACTLAIAASHASAEDVAQLGSAIETDKIALTGLQTDMNQKTSENERRKKGYDIYADKLEPASARWSKAIPRSPPTTPSVTANCRSRPSKSARA